MHNTHGNTEFEKLETTIKYFRVAVFKCITSSFHEKLNLLRKKEKRVNNNICKKFCVIDNVCKEKNADGFKLGQPKLFKSEISKISKTKETEYK